MPLTKLRMMKLRLGGPSTPFDLESTLRCGQLFRWEKQDDWWFGIVERQVLKMRQMTNILEFEGADPQFVEEYFRLQDDLPHIISTINRDAFIRRATEAFPGLRIVRQAPWECLISYICATYKNIPSIKGMIFELSEKFGEEVKFGNRVFYAFPEPEVLARASRQELVRCRLGFRAKRVRQAARAVAENEVDFEALRKADYREARNELLNLPGVGHKVADVWIKRIVQERYSHWFDASFVSRISGKKSLSPREYDKVSSLARDYFGKYAGYAQEYLFHFARSKLTEEIKPDKGVI
jgi:N-glycosylase/DNA lyase